jgi:replication factor C subunit 3/5
MSLLWVDKHRPKSLDELDYHAGLTDRLKCIAKSGEMPHLLVSGPSGAGKSTRVQALLREIYGQGAEMIKVETRSVAPNPNVPSNTVDIQVVVSNYHLSVTPSDIGNKDRAVIMQLIKEVAEHQHLGTHAFKVVVIEEAGCLSNDAQAALRRTMERYMKSCRIILTCDTVSKIIAPLRSRCLPIRVAAPSVNEVTEVLMKTATKESVKLAPEFAQKIAETTNRDMRRAMLMLETAHAQANSSSLGKELTCPRESWEAAVDKVARKILSDQSPRMAMEVRGNVYELLAACLPPDFILKELCAKLVAELRADALKQKTLAAAAHFESTMRQGTKDIFHIEAFVLRFMADYKASA